MRVLLLNQYYKPDTAATGQLLADVAERAERSDIERAEAARQRALEMLSEAPPEERRLTEVALRRSDVRLRVARRRRRVRPSYPETGESD